jgi:hypothetical protein
VFNTIFLNTLKLRSSFNVIDHLLKLHKKDKTIIIIIIIKEKNQKIKEL